MLKLGWLRLRFGQESIFKVDLQPERILLMARLCGTYELSDFVFIKRYMSLRMWIVVAFSIVVVYYYLDFKQLRDGLRIISWYYYAPTIQD